MTDAERKEAYRRLNGLFEELGICDYFYGGYDLTGDRIANYAVGTEDPQITNKIRCEHIVGLMSVMQHFLYHNTFSSGDDFQQDKE